jgi:hypothetical protein
MVVRAAIGARDKSTVMSMPSIGTNNLNEVTVVVMVVAAIDSGCVNQAAPTIGNCDNLNQVAATAASIRTMGLTQVAVVASI